MMRDDFTFECPNCDNISSTNKCSNNETVPPYDDKPHGFYVTCHHCFNVYSVEYVVTLTEVMRSNLTKEI